MKIHGFNDAVTPRGDPALDSRKSTEKKNKTIIKTDITDARKTALNPRIIETPKDTLELGNKPETATYGPIELTRTKRLNSTETGEEKRAKVRQNVADGYYNSPEFIDKLADKLIMEFDLFGENDKVENDS